MRSASGLTPKTGRFLLDTNIVIALLQGDDGVLSNLDRAAEVFVPAVVLGELFFGAAKSGRPSENTARVERFAAGRTIVSCDLNVAREYGRLKQLLKVKGRPLPENDIWIAAAAMHHGMVLVTRDRHFDEVDDLRTTEWAVQP
jgi:tRNA(fMet)-specific endonuclease VapC